MATFQDDFEPKAEGFSIRNAYWLGVAADLAYAARTKVLPTLSAWGFEQAHFVNVGDTEGFICANKSCALLLFRGTQATRINDWFTDLECRQVDGPRGKIHRGFAKALDPTWPEISRWLAQHAADVPLYIAGHSLGGALAVLAAAKRRLPARGSAWPVQGLYTYGQPRVGDGAFVGALESDFKSRWFRFVNNNDVVTRVPMRAMGYADGGIVRYFDEDGDMSDELGWWKKLVDHLEGRIKDLLKPGTDGMKDHSMARYLENLKRAMRRAKRKGK